MLLLSDISMVADAKEEGMIDSRNIVAAHEIYNLAAMETMNVGANTLKSMTQSFSFPLSGQFHAAD